MKNIFIIFLSLVSIKNVSAQKAEIKIDTGRINGASYKILFPKNWKGKLVMYAHGYEFTGTPTRQSKSSEFNVQMHPFLERGFAVAASDYSSQGFALPEGVDDTEALRQYFIKTYGKIDTTFMVGHSMGGGVTLATIENFGRYYNGGLPLCPLSSRPYLQCRKEFDIYATFNGLFPGVVPSLAEIFDITKAKPTTPHGEMMPKVMAIRKAIIKKDSLGAVAFARHFDLKFDDLPFSLFFNENVLRDIALKAQGNPFDNTNTVYSGFPDNWEVNIKAERLQATVNPDVVFGKYDRTGNIDKPVLLMHTIYDQLIPPVYGVVNFENMVHQKGRDQYFTVKYTNGQGHCAFSPQQTGQAFDELRKWTKTGKKAKAGIIP
jgi:pimeloyl-ACP methyl ester carboxylesterase